jgi:hypothetical protein
LPNRAVPTRVTVLNQGLAEHLERPTKAAPAKRTRRATARRCTSRATGSRSAARGSRRPELHSRLGHAAQRAARRAHGTLIDCPTMSALR